MVTRHRDRVTEWFEVYKWPPSPRLEVARGPAPGNWSLVAYVPDRETAEAVLARWRRQFPRQVVALLRDGQIIEDALAKAERLVRERREREATYFERFAAEARGEGRPDDEARYLRLAERFRQGTLGPPT
jgi:hypothetical protein